MMSTQGPAISNVDVNIHNIDDEILQSDVYGEYAGFVTRLVAFITDLVIIVVMISMLGSVASLLGDFLSLNDATTKILNASVVLSSLVLMQVYLILFWMLIGQTPGKYLMGLRIIRTDGSRVTVGVCIRRLIGYYISAFLMLGYLLVLFDNRRQGFHDKFAGTFVVYAWSFDKNLERSQPIRMRAQQQRSKDALKNTTAV